MITRKKILLTVVFFIGLGMIFFNSYNTHKPLRIVSTTSTENSGFFDYILPKFTKGTGIEVVVLAQGTGQAIKSAKNGDADVLFVHHKSSEEQFVLEGYGVKRYDVMYNDFVVLGNKHYKQKFAKLSSLYDVFTEISQSGSEFISRGDNSGTHKKELSLWEKTVVSLNGSWYKEVGAGMGATLNIATSKDAFTLSDRATWLFFNNKKDLDVVYEGDIELFNQYGVIAVNPKKFSHVQFEKAEKFIQWLLSEKGQNLINSYKIQGKQAFFANAK